MAPWHADAPAGTGLALLYPLGNPLDLQIATPWNPKHPAPTTRPLIHRTRHNEVQPPLCVMAVLGGFGQYVASKRERAEAVLPVHMRDYLRKKPAGQWKSLHVAHESHMWTT